LVLAALGTVVAALLVLYGPPFAGVPVALGLLLLVLGDGLGRLVRLSRRSGGE